VGHVPAPRRRRNNFDFPAKRRREIVLHARHVGAMETEDRSRWLIAWVWHNRKAKDQIWSVMEAAKRMGGKITEAEASGITEEASICRKHLSADNLARFLGVSNGKGWGLRQSGASTSAGERGRNCANEWTASTRRAAAANVARAHNRNPYPEPNRGRQ